MLFNINIFSKWNTCLFRYVLCLLFLPFTSLAETPSNWWNAEWSARKKITINTGASGVPLDFPATDQAVLVRLSSDFPFLEAREDGSDLRFIGADHKTVLISHIERWDGLLNEAFVWVKVPELAPQAATDIWLYYGNAAAQAANDPAGTCRKEALGVYHFSDAGGVPSDSSPSGVASGGTPVPVATALIGGGVRFTGQNVVTIPGEPSLTWTEGGALTVSVWVKPAVLTPNAVVFSRRENDNAFVLGIDNGTPFVSVSTGGNIHRAVAGAPLANGTWNHLAAVAENDTTTLYVNGEAAGSAPSGAVALSSVITVGKDSDGIADTAGFAGEMDELNITAAAISAGLIRFAAVNQGATADAGKLLVFAEPESAAGAGEHNEIMEHVMLLGDISKSLTFDGWVVIWLCAILAIIGWAVAISKLIYISKIAKSSRIFLRQWEAISTDITALDHADEEHVKSMGGSVGRQDQMVMRQSPLFHLYHQGSQEIQHRLASAKGAFNGLSERSISSIRALLDSGMTRETQKLHSKLVFLTIGIAGGPYLGLFGTVIGVMITFAVIAKSGEVDINSIAPGIAGALLATVAGLAVAIPALFAYSYLSSRIKDIVLSMSTFIDEFIARIAEAYPSQD